MWAVVASAGSRMRPKLAPSVQPSWSVALGRCTVETVNPFRNDHSPDKFLDSYSPLLRDFLQFPVDDIV